MKSIKRFILIFLVMTFVILSGCTNKLPEEATSDSFHNTEFPVNLNGNLEITDAFLYSGEFPEDGSFSEKSDVFALKVVNRSSDDLRLVRIYVTTDKKECLFEITTLPSQKSATVFEKNAQTLSDDEKIIRIREENTVYFKNKISVESDKFQITPFDKVLNIKNISTEDFSSDVYVYFKKTDSEGNYYGGITFCSKAGTLKSNELKQIPASHFNIDDSEVLFVGYAMQ